MLHKGKLIVFLSSALIVLYGVSAAFYGKVVAKDEGYKELSVFMDALNKINKDYVEAPDMNKVQEGAMRGLLEALDPYSSFMTKEEYEALEKRNASGKAGTGMIISKRADVIFVVSVAHDGAAAAAGIRPGDYLVAIDGSGIDDKSILEVESLLRGEPGTKVKVTVFRSARSKPLDLELTRKIEAPVPVVAKMMDDSVGYLGISSLADSTVEQSRVKLKTLLSAGAQKLILDLRDCADGKVADGAEVANFFLKSGLIYYSQDRRGERVQQVQADAAKFVTDVPMVVLINGSTAGPAEIAAGALKDHKRATIVGDKSFGVGSSQTMITLKSGAVLILSTARYYTPDGKMIQDDSTRKTGIAPDVQAPSDDRRQDLMVESYYDDQDDAGKYRELEGKIDQIQLNKALEILSKAAEQPKKAA